MMTTVFVKMYLRVCAVSAHACGEEMAEKIHALEDCEVLRSAKRSHGNL